MFLYYLETFLISSLKTYDYILCMTENKRIL